MQFSRKYALNNQCFHETKTTKDMIVLHFTAGSSGATAASWFASRKDRVSTPYVVDTDGTIFELYDPAYWSFHLGIKGTHDHDKRSIGIEIANMGPLMLRDKTLCSWPNNFKQHYCEVTDTDRYVKSKFRGYEYYAAYTPAQFDSVKQLVAHLTEQFKISTAIPPEDKRNQFDMNFFSSYAGIASHQNFRADKFDVGPAFDWSIFNDNRE